MLAEPVSRVVEHVWTEAVSQEFCQRGIPPISGIQSLPACNFHDRDPVVFHDGLELVQNRIQQ